MKYHAISSVLLWKKTANIFFILSLRKKISSIFFTLTVENTKCIHSALLYPQFFIFLPKILLYSAKKITILVIQLQRKGHDNERFAFLMLFMNQLWCRLISALQTHTKHIFQDKFFFGSFLSITCTIY